MRKIAGELLVLSEKGVFPVGAENVMAVLDLIDHRGEFAAQSLVEPDAEDLADPVGRQTPEADFAAPLEDLMDGEVALEDEVAAVFDLARWSRSATGSSGRVPAWRTSVPG